MDTNRLPNIALQYKPKAATICTEDENTDYRNKHFNINPKGLQHV